MRFPGHKHEIAERLRKIVFDFSMCDVFFNISFLGRNPFDVMTCKPKQGPGASLSSCASD